MWLRERLLLGMFKRVWVIVDEQEKRNVKERRENTYMYASDYPRLPISVVLSMIRLSTVDMSALESTGSTRGDEAAGYLINLAMHGCHPHAGTARASNGNYATLPIPNYFTPCTRCGTCRFRAIESNVSKARNSSRNTTMKGINFTIYWPQLIN